MNRSTKKSVSYSIVLCILITILGINMPLCNAAEQQSISELSGPEKTLTIINDVVGIDLAAYNATLDLNHQELDYKGLFQEDVKYTLESAENKLEVISTFVNKKMRSINIYADGSPHITHQADSTVEMAKDFINSYQTVSGDSHYGTLVPMLDNVEANKNVTKTFENVKLKVTINANYTSYRWIYTVNDIEAPRKCIALKFEKGFLKYFIDNWNLYTIGNTDIKLSEEEAIQIAMDRTKNHSWNVSMGGEVPPLTVTEFNVVGVSETKLSFVNFPTNNESRGGDPLTLYPGWQVKLHFDKLYQGSVYGVDVGIWADNGEVNEIRELLFLGDFSSNPDVVNNGETNDETNPKMVPILWIFLPITALLVLTIAYSNRKRKKTHEIHDELKSNSLILRGALLCLLISFTMIPMTIVIPKIKADTYVLPLYGATANITSTEEWNAQTAINVWEYYFDTYTNYTVYDLFGSDTQRDTVYDHAEAFEDNFDHVSMLHYGHGGYNVSNWHHRDYFDDDGYLDEDNLIWDYEIYDRTSGKTDFVVIWACFQGNFIGDYDETNGHYGMPYSWFHGAPTSNDCFIGFKNASMPLSQKFEGISYRAWLEGLGIHLSLSHYTVMQALDQTSNQYFDCDYDETELVYPGFSADWPYFGEGPGEMRIYGNSSIKVW